MHQLFSEILGPPAADLSAGATFVRSVKLIDYNMVFKCNFVLSRDGQSVVVSQQVVCRPCLTIVQRAYLEALYLDS